MLNADEEEATGDSSNADEGYQDDINETEEGRKKTQGICSLIRFFFSFFFHNPYNLLKLMTVFKYFQIIQQSRLTF